MEERIHQTLINIPFPFLFSFLIPSFIPFNERETRSTAFHSDLLKSNQIKSDQMRSQGMEKRIHHL